MIATPVFNLMHLGNYITEFFFEQSQPLSCNDKTGKCKYILIQGFNINI